MKIKQNNGCEFQLRVPSQAWPSGELPAGAKMRVLLEVPSRSAASFFLTLQQSPGPCPPVLALPSPHMLHSPCGPVGRSRRVAVSVPSCLTPLRSHTVRNGLSFLSPPPWDLRCPKSQAPHLLCLEVVGMWQAHIGRETKESL